MSETGSVKFRYQLDERQLEPFAGFDEINACRRKLLQMRLLGVDANGIGFGNISVRDGATNCFYVSGSGTGASPTLTLREFARVAQIDLAANWLRCEGVTVASAESLTHATLYIADGNVGAVIHGHSASLWNQLCRGGSMTSADVEYGTPALAQEVLRLFRETDVRDRKVFAMGGHADGVIAFGSTPQNALDALIKCSE